MTSTTERPKQVTVEEAPAGTPPKLVRRPVVIAASAVLTLVGVLGGGWLWNALTNVEQVLVAVNDIPRGAVIKADDLGVATLNADPLLKPVAASERSEVAGQRAATDLAAGSLLTPASTTGEVLPPDGQSLVPIELTPPQAVGLDLHVGDRVRVVDTPPDGGEAAGNPATTQAEVALLTITPSTGTTVVSLLVPADEAGPLAARVASENVALVLESRER